MANDAQAEVSGWEATYRNQAVEAMPWFYPELDDDLRRALDLGTGPGSQNTGVAPGAVGSRQPPNVQRVASASMLLQA